MMQTNKILIADDEPNNLKVLQQILKDDYQLIFANNGEKAVAATKKHKPDLILLDIMMPELNGYEACKKIKEDSEVKNIPIIFVTAMGEVDDETYGFDVGAVDYILKPISAPIVQRRVKTHLSLVQAEEFKRLSEESIHMLGDAGHYNDTDTGHHIWRMAAYSSAIAKAAGWNNQRSDFLKLAAAMHDTGKIGIPDSILKAPRKLTEEEWVIMKQHSQIGYDILSCSNNPVFKLAAEIALYHHEKWNGAGYPEALAGEDIPESARIVAIADVFDALTMKRPYKEEWPVEKAMKVISEDSGTHFDPRLTEVFFNIHDEILKIKNDWQDIDDPELENDYESQFSKVGS